MKGITQYKSFYYGKIGVKEADGFFSRPESFDKVLKSLYQIMYNFHVGILGKSPKTMRIDRKIYGKRKNIH